MSQPNQSQSRPPSQASDRPQPESESESESQAFNHPSPTQSRPASQASNRSPSVSRSPPRTHHGRSQTPQFDPDSKEDDDNTQENLESKENEDLEESSKTTKEQDNAEDDANVDGHTADVGPDADAGAGEEGSRADKSSSIDSKKKRRRRGKKTRGFGVDKWPHGDNPGKLEPPHGVDDWPYGDSDDSEGVGVSGKRLKRPKGIRDFSPAYEPSDAGESNSSRWTDRTDYSQVSGLSLGNWGNSSLPGVDNWPYGDNPGIMIKPRDHWGNPLRNPDGTLVQKENFTGLPTYDELREMDLDTHDDHVIKLKLELDIDIAVEINARIHGDLTLALLM